MARQGRRPARGRGIPVKRNRAAPAQRFPPPKPPQPKAQPKTTKTQPKPLPAAAATDEREPRTFRLGAVPGATPGRWIDTWKRRMPDVPLELVTIDPRAQRAALDDVDAAIIRLPVDDDELHVIPLYDEQPVVVASTDSHLLAANELDPADLAGEVLITPLDDVLGPLDLPGTIAPSFPPLETTADAIATAASGVGIVVVPMSLARLHHRRDVDYRVLRGGPTSRVGLAWRRDRTTPDVETFVGIVRGRTANSSR